MRLTAFALWLAIAMVVSSCRQPTDPPAAPNTDTSGTLSPSTPANGDKVDNNATQQSQPCVDLNTADVDQLTTLPGIGDGLAARIIEYRSQHGPFRRPQDIIIINGFGERRYHKLESFVCVH
ncbi:MAG TPA: helix-hairpin-helix domain-containing protein [Blastocatellia bacterium]